ncbi:MAG: alginate lyase family protein [Candidatus Pedobacter colombiensis]|uniref:Alginate lyase family protein n=1 Tax=Candidatus Pedobacter colombiensis TaxID=3121371 RepID=A0AAJ6B8H7_9SPHI|nr:alginate lyase family protein [Pedobacter sp.]WEK20899.1 MAG: alginate lyase family protein [Pedobacter sp.]
MKYKLISGLLFALCMQSISSPAQKLVLLDPAHMVAQKARFKQGNTDVVKAVNIIIKNADKLLEDKPKSVMDKAFVPPSGSKHDYMSMAPYFWPDPSKPDSLPYIRKDGQRNPEIKKMTDHTYLTEMADKCKFLSLAYYFTKDEKYAAKASKLINVWFIDPATRMNPNLNYAQAIRGINDGRGIGIIESRCLINLADWMGLLEGSPSFTDKNLINVKEWYTAYLNWMLTSKNGIDELNAKNNHGTHYDGQVIAYALFVGKNQLAKKISTESKARIAAQIAPNGEQKLELARTNALGYSTFNLEAWATVAMLAAKTDVDIWNYTTADGRGLHQAFNWLAPYALKEKPWNYEQISPYNKNNFYQLLMLASNKYKDSAYITKAKSIQKTDDILITDLLFN